MSYRLKYVFVCVVPMALYDSERSRQVVPDDSEDADKLYKTCCVHFCCHGKNLEAPHIYIFTDTIV